MLILFTVGIIPGLKSCKNFFLAGRFNPMAQRLRDCGSIRAAYTEK